MTTSSPVSGPIVRICRGCVRTSPSPRPDGSRSHQWPRQPSPFETHASLRLRVSFCSPGSFHPKYQQKSQKLMSHEAFFPTSQEAAPSNKVFSRAWRRPPPPPLENFSSWLDPKNYEQKPSSLQGKQHLKVQLQPFQQLLCTCFFIVSVSSWMCFNFTFDHAIYL